MHDRPYGPAGSEYLQGGPGRRYPVLGRSIDGEWIALRPVRLENRWNQQYGWLPRDSVRLNVDAASLPIVASSDLEVISVDANGVFGRQYAVVEGAPDVRWRGDNALVGAGDGLWEWRPFSETPRVIDDRRWNQLSPDGRWCLATTACLATLMSAICESCRPMDMRRSRFLRLTSIVRFAWQNALTGHRTPNTCESGARAVPQRMPTSSTSSESMGHTLSHRSARGCVG